VQLVVVPGWPGRDVLFVLVSLTALLLLAQAPTAQAASGSITNVHAVGGEVKATYTTNMDICDETASEDFYPEYGSMRICLYARQGDSFYLIAESVYYAGPAPNRRFGFTVGDQNVSFYYPQSCVIPGRTVQRQVRSKKKKKSKVPHTTVKRVDFSLDGLKRTDKKKPWEATFSTEGFVPGSTHKAVAKITFKQPHGKKVRKKVKKTFTIC
jgi:hypothetical protein